MPSVLPIHEESDKTVKVSNSDDFVAALKKAGEKNVTYERYTYGSGHHELFRPAKVLNPVLEEFFAKHLKPHSLNT